MSILGRDETEVTKWTLDAEQFKKELADLAKDLRAAERAQKDLNTVKAALEKEAKKAAEAVAKETVEVVKQTKAAGECSVKNIALGTALGNVLSKGARMAWDALKDLARTSLEYEDIVGDNEQAVVRMGQATANLVPPLQAARNYNRLHQQDLFLTAKEMDAVSKAAIMLGRNMHIGVEESLKKVTDTVLKGTVEGMQELGIKIDLTGTAAEKSERAIKELTARYGSMQIEAINTNERIDQLKNSFTTIVGAIGSAILKSDLFTAAMKAMSKAAREMAESWLNAQDSTSQRQVAITDRIREIRKELADLGANDRGQLTSAPGEGVRSVTGSGNLTAGFTMQREAAYSHDARMRKSEAMKLAGELQALQDEFTKNRLAREKAAEDRRNAEKLADAEALEKRKAALQRGIAEKNAKKGYDEKTAPWAEVVAEHQYKMQSDAQKYMGQREVAISQQEKESKANLRLAQSLARIRLAYDRAGMAHDEYFRGVRASIAEQEKHTAIIERAKDAVSGMAGGALADLAGGMWAAADAAIQSGESFGAAMGKMVKATLLGIAQQATVRALFELAEAWAWFGTPFFATHMKAAAIFGVTAAVAGSAGLAMSAAGVGGGGAKERDRDRNDRYRPSYGRSSSKEQPIVVQVYMGDGDDPGAVLFATKQIEARLARAA